jgi:hypothetical protein
LGFKPQSIPISYWTQCQINQKIKENSSAQLNKKFLGDKAIYGKKYSLYVSFKGLVSSS